MQELTSTKVEPGDKITVVVNADNGELKDSETWPETLTYVGEQDLSAQSRKVSYEFENADGQKAFIRHKATHKNNMGFKLSQEDKSTLEFDAMWQDVLTDDRDWTVEKIIVE